ncbi:MaoC family dehydratase N-terminal domain-containing protein [Metabacillus rhizolycopersici]|uniref:MaoC family dehydratase N-terminal domain-containing protein n=1 Tax=Metabacillus rhizolycopersici TaxID=2875709 RepID=A0ABS7UY96_9BACI|nr:MaoC family dehydratase N-terminal domain-containing protein [Metabacillus rhizolycopersici]MBZ5752957.1 MaoC family dehydratase N-terminal domain-containing protein [Metabacillus rhizolycopersici]
MLIDPSIIGSTSESQIFEIEKGAIRSFAQAIGDDNPLYRDEAFAKECGYRSIVAPPTFPTTIRVFNPKVKFEPSRVLHGGQEYLYERPIVAGDILCCASSVTDVYEREGKLGKMTFLIQETRGEDLEGNLVYRGINTLIVR